MVFDSDRLNVFQQLSLEASLCIFWFLIGVVATPRRHWPGDTCSSHELYRTGPADNDVGVEDLAGEVEPLVGHSEAGWKRVAVGLGDDHSKNLDGEWSCECLLDGQR